MVSMCRKLVSKRFGCYCKIFVFSMMRKRKTFSSSTKSDSSIQCCQLIIFDVFQKLRSQVRMKSEKAQTKFSVEKRKIYCHLTKISWKHFKCRNIDFTKFLRKNDEMEFTQTLFLAKISWKQRLLKSWFHDFFSCCGREMISRFLTYYSVLRLTDLYFFENHLWFSMFQSAKVEISGA